MQGVTLASLHAAKGLEWDAVFLVGLTDGTMPIQHADGDDDAVEEERRLFYVGVTRARVHLRLSWALSRNAGGRRSRRRSRFLYGLVPDEHPAARVPTGRGENGGWRGKPTCRLCGKPLPDPASAKLGRCSTHPSDVDEELLEALRTWRSAEAKSRSVPAYVVFTDATLIALAEQRPADPSGLVAIPGHRVVEARALRHRGAHPAAGARLVGGRPGPVRRSPGKFSKMRCPPARDRPTVDHTPAHEAAGRAVRRTWDIEGARRHGHRHRRGHRSPRRELAVAPRP